MKLDAFLSKFNILKQTIIIRTTCEIKSKPKLRGSDTKDPKTYSTSMLSNITSFFTEWHMLFRQIHPGRKIL